MPAHEGVEPARGWRAHGEVSSGEVSSGDASSAAPHVSGVGGGVGSFSGGWREDHPHSSASKPPRQQTRAEFRQLLLLLAATAARKHDLGPPQHLSPAATAAVAHQLEDSLAADADRHPPPRASLDCFRAGAQACNQRSQRLRQQHRVALRHCRRLDLRAPSPAPSSPAAAPTAPLRRRQPLQLLGESASEAIPAMMSSTKHKCGRGAWAAVQCSAVQCSVG